MFELAEVGGWEKDESRGFSMDAGRGGRYGTGVLESGEWVRGECGSGGSGFILAVELGITSARVRGFLGERS